jgi:hypothetical protein
MQIDDIKIEDTADANYFIKKFFNNDYSKIQMTQLEQLVLAAYNMGKKDSGSSGGGDSEASEKKPAEKAPKKAAAKAPPPFKINDRVKILADTEIGHSGEFIKAESIGSISYIKGDTMTALFEAGEDGEMIDIMVLPDKIVKV